MNTTVLTNPRFSRICRSSSAGLLPKGRKNPAAVNISISRCDKRIANPYINSVWITNPDERLFSISTAKLRRKNEMAKEITLFNIKEESLERFKLLMKKEKG